MTQPLIEKSAEARKRKASGSLDLQHESSEFTDNAKDSPASTTQRTEDNNSLMNLPTSLRTTTQGTPQNIHTPFLASFRLSARRRFGKDMKLSSGRNQEYHDWWQQDPGNKRLFGARLVGDAQQPFQASSMSLTELAFCR